MDGTGRFFCPPNLMHRMRPFIFVLLITLCLTGFVPRQDPPEICQNPANIMTNCHFSEGGNGWQQFTEEGGAAFSVLQGGGECHAPSCPAGYIVVEDYFVGGIFQQVSASPGQAYHANVVWLVFDSLTNDASIRNAVGGGMGRKVGIDPFGGTDPRSPNVIWSPEKWDNNCKICDEYQIIATAQADRITVFLRIDDRWKVRARDKGYPVPPSKDQFWIDDFGVMPTGEQPVVPQSVPTDTPEPTSTPIPPPPTATDIPAPTDTPIPTPTALPDVSASTDQQDEIQAEISDPLTITNAISQSVALTTALSKIDTIPITPTVIISQAVNSLAQIDEAKVVEAPPTITPTPTATPAAEPAPRLAQNNAPPAEESSSLLPAVDSVNPSHEPPRNRVTNSWQTAFAVTGCITGLLMMLAAVMMGGVVWFYRFNRGQPAPLAEPPTYSVEIIDE